MMSSLSDKNSLCGKRLFSGSESSCSFSNLKRPKRNAIRPVRRNCGAFSDQGSETYSESHTSNGSQIENVNLGKRQLKLVVDNNASSSTCEVLPSEESGVEHQPLVEKTQTDGERIRWGCHDGKKNALARGVEEGEIVEEDSDEEFGVESGKGAAIQDEKNKQCHDDGSALVREVEEGEIVEDIDDHARTRAVNEKCIGDKLEGDNAAGVMIYPGEIKSFSMKRQKKLSNCALMTVGTVSRCKDQKYEDMNLEPNFANGKTSLIDGKEDGDQCMVAVSGDTEKDGNAIAIKEPNDLSIVLSDSRVDPSHRKVKEALNLFQRNLEKLLLSKKKVSVYTYIEAAMQVKEQGKWVNMNERILGDVPGVEVGDKFHCRAELVVIGLHHPFAAGIDAMEKDGKKIAISIVSSGRYANETEFSDVLIYSGEGGNPAIKDREIKDQTLERGNLALKNSMDAGTPVRVIRGYRVWKRVGNRKREKEATFTYDGLYGVTKFWQDKGKHGKMVYMFQLNKLQGQPKLTLNNSSSRTEKSKILNQSRFSKLLSRSKKSKTSSRLGKSMALHPHHTTLMDDISCGKEKIPIRAINEIDNEKPPIFNYIANVVYPQFQDSSTMTKGCQCVDGCSDYKKCCCVIKNVRRELPFNEHGAIIRITPRIVYECGPRCRCPPSCMNRVSQHGIRYPLEIFKTESRGWGIRSRESIPSGGFVCEYVGELLDDKQAAERMDCDEYLFNLGNVGDDGFAIDAEHFGNVGRFLNHSCSPNLSAQNVLFDHDNKMMPHIMLFATKNIPPLEELTFYYNYKIDGVYDANGNVKKKACHCGARDCCGRMY